MNSPTVVDQQPVDKGKSRAETPPATERTPLLASQSYTSHDDAERTTRGPHRLLSKLTCVFLISLSVCIILFLVVALIAYSYAARVSEFTPSDLLDTAVVVDGPSRVDVLNITGDGAIWVNVEGRVGIDVGSVLGVKGDGDDEGFWKDVWKWMGRWGIRRLDNVSVHLSTIEISSRHNQSNVLASVDIPPLQLPLTPSPPPDLSWLTTISVPLFIRPTRNASAITQFAQDAWRDGTIAIQAHIGKVAVHGGALDEHSWRRKIKTERIDVLTSIRIKIPPLPGLPQPGRNSPFPPVSELVTLQTFGVTSDSNQLLLNARATVVDPAPLNFNFTSPMIPFIVSIPSDKSSSSAEVPVASVYTQPFSLTHPNITLLISGLVLPLPSSSSPLLSSFISRYLSSEDNPIVISTPLFPDFTVETVFPAPESPPRILRNVTIRDMKIKPTGSGGTFLASGTVYARVVLPRGMDIGLSANRVFPDVLVFDGEVPDYVIPTSNLDVMSDNGTSRVPSTLLPDPLPERAFGHIKPDDWIRSTSERDDSHEGEGSAYIVTGDIEDVPLQVLPGREREFSNFVRKVIFDSRGALAGIRGSAAVAVAVDGLPILNGSGPGSEMELTGLPFKGSLRVGKKNLFEADIDRLRRIMEGLPWHWHWPA